MKFVEFIIEKLSGPAPSEPPKRMESSGIVLVAGATGGVGRRVVDILRKKGLPVRVLVLISCLALLVALTCPYVLLSLKRELTTSMF